MKTIVAIKTVLITTPDCVTETSFKVFDDYTYNKNKVDNLIYTFFKASLG